MIKFLMASAFCFMGFISWSAHATDAELTIPSAVEVSPRSEVTIYDIVEAKNMSSDVADDLKEIVIDANAMNKADLARALRSVKARFVLPKELKIIRSRGSISRMEVERKVKNKIYSDCARCEVQVQISSVPANVQGDWDMDLNIDLSKSNVMIPVYSTKNTDNKGWIIADIRRYQKVPVLTRSIKLGDILTEDMFTMETRQLTQSRDTVQSIQAVAGMQAVRFLNAGQILRYADVKKEQVVKRGQMVRAMVGSDDFEVAIAAEVQEAGSVGDVVKIKNLDSQKVFAARIVDRGLVRIE